MWVICILLLCLVWKLVVSSDQTGVRPPSYTLFNCGQGYIWRSWTLPILFLLLTLLTLREKKTFRKIKKLPSKKERAQCQCPPALLRMSIFNLFLFVFFNPNWYFQIIWSATANFYSNLIYQNTNCILNFSQ